MNHLQVVQVLLEGEASIGHIGHDDGLAALHLAIIAQNIECVKALLGARVDANILTLGKLTSLMLAAELGSPEVVQQLIHAGARVDYACQPGRGTPLHAAVQSDSIAVLKLLLESPGPGRCCTGEMPLVAAQGRSRRDILVSPRNELFLVAILYSRRRLRTYDLGL